MQVHQSHVVDGAELLADAAHGADGLEAQFYAEGAAAYEDTLRTNAVYRSDDVHAYLKARVAGEKPTRPKAVALDARKPIRRAKN